MNSVKDNITTILDCFSGTDGGISFVKLRFFLESLEKNDTSENAQKMLEAVDKLAKLITFLSK